MKVVNLTLIIALVTLSFYLLIVGESLLLPLVIAIVFWYLINLLSDLYSRIKIAGKPFPGWLNFSFSIFTFIGGIWFLVSLIAMNIDGVVENAPSYQANFVHKVDILLNAVGIDEAPTISQFIDTIDLPGVIAVLASSITSIAARSGVIMIYLVFLLIEQSSFDKKITALINDPHREKKVRRLLKEIGDDVRKYISIKMVTSIITGLVSYSFLRFVGVDFAEFWAVLIFLLNFIPTVGSIIATIFPALLTLVQFDTWTPFILVVVGVSSIQVLVGNLAEPKLMGNSLNLSPMIILLNLTLWGLIWGVPGMFLCVPFLVISKIVFSHIPQTRAIAVILSKDGQIGNETEHSEILQK